MRTTAEVRVPRLPKDPLSQLATRELSQLGAGVRHHQAGLRQQATKVLLVENAKSFAQVLGSEIH